MNSKSLAIRFFTLVLVMASSMCQGSYIKSNTLEIDFTNPKEARKKALWFPADKLNVTKQGLGWDAEAAELRPGEIQTKPIALGHSWRTPPNIYVRVTILPPPKAILLNDGKMSTSYPGNVFVRYSPDLKNWSSWIILEHSYRKSSDKNKRNERCYEGRISVTQRSRNEYYKLLDNYSKLDVPWKSDEEAAVRWILKQQPNFFSKNIPFIGYVEFLFESNFYGGQRIKSFKADISYCINGRHYPPSNTNIYNKRSAIPWRFKAKQNDVIDKAKQLSLTISTRNGFIDGVVKNTSNKDVKICELFGYWEATTVLYKTGFKWLEASLKKKWYPIGFFHKAILKPGEKRKFTLPLNNYSFLKNIRENIKVKIVTNDIWSNIIEIKNPNKKIKK